ncbi:MAG TPA: hypothetical protein VHZ04_00250 [Candidatus Paceibacterota bacterium]|jgi:hypothetical protein|nr:hypothetical protein [Candidatus Paceibacterota bacterium]
MKKILRHKTVSLVSLGSFLLVAGGCAWAWVALRGVAGSPLILHFDDIGGITAVGGPGSLVFMGVLGIVVVLMNFAISLELEERNPLLGKIVAGVTFIFAALLFIAFAAIINVN